KNRKIFANSIGMFANNVYRYINSNTTPSYDKLIKFQEAGLSIDWLVSGVGDMFADNSKGMELKEKYESLESNESRKPFDRLKKWIARNYGSLQDFSIIMNTDYREAHDILYDEFFMAPEFIKLLDRAGCNIDWVLTDEGSEYSNSPVGHILKENRDKIEENNADNLPEQTTVYSYGKEQQSGLYEIIKSLVQEEFDKVKKDKKS
ncbi:MAG: hypothetical protein PF588_07590, partial [Candidatus Kapabacteria bacterium]|nr:hypothetical protein [Candidatus Kapabacteria bacterium]